jgi:hypothetical protein
MKKAGVHLAPIDLGEQKKSTRTLFLLFSAASAE